MHFTLSDLVTDITQNGAESGASLVELELRERNSPGKGEFRFTVRDNGKGMDQDELERVVDPFVTDGIKHPRRKVGLGIPFLIQTAQMSGGGWSLKSEKGRGTEISAWFDTGNVDTPPVGDLPGMMRTVLLFEGPGEVVIRRSRNGTDAGGNAGKDALEYEVRKTELAEALGGLEDTGSLVLMERYLRSLEDDEA
ncbi:MAG: sensor histidine kinase [Treponema sp.]|nr:sensor histidine kinase [Treponema sp.]